MVEPPILIDRGGETEIVRHYGGEINEVARVLARRRLRINGPCHSACAFEALARPDTCVTARAHSMVHAVRSGFGGPINYFLTAFYLHRLPPALVAIIEQRGDILSGEEVHLSARDLRRAGIPLCLPA